MFCCFIHFIFKLNGIVTRQVKSLSKFFVVFYFFCTFHLKIKKSSFFQSIRPPDRPIFQGPNDTNQTYFCEPPKSTSCMTEYFQSWHTEVHTSALDVIGKWKIININQRPSNPILKTAMANKSCIELAIRVHDTKNMQSLLNKMHQTTVRETILSIEATRTDRFLKHMLDTGGVNSKCFWNIKRRICQSNLEDLTAIIDDQGNRLYHSNEILNYTL